MPKRVALKDHVLVDSADLSNFARAVTLNSEHDRVDVSGFNPTGASEYLAGITTQSVTVEFFGSYGSGEVHQTLYPVHRDREIVPFEWRPDQTGPVSTTNPQLEGNVQVLTYSPAATRGDAETFSVEFTAADPAGLAFVTTP
jgi:predicted secreted protein